jgi:alkyl sulfatase BDS1-like metallo-beta-lactamase superfamily hydrolase
VRAVIYTHSHADHWGGVRGVVDEAEFQAGRVHIIAPLGFMEHAVSENVIAGNAMSRRAQYQFGTWLPRGPRGQVDTGLGKTLAVNGTLSLLPPTMVVEKPVQDVDVDGVIMQFQQTPGSEAPAEMNIWFRELKLLNMAENVTHNMHNLYTIRGAEVRDGNLWARYIQQSLDRYGNEAEVMIAQHHWPTWGNGAVRTRLAKHRDLYKFMHDQSARLLNQGYGPLEIAERLSLPKGLASEWSTRGYYGTLSHNAKAVYQKYLGWYDANPANLNPLPPAAAARKTVEYMGGAAAVIGRAREDYRKGEYRWVAQVMNQVVFADPGNAEARGLAADALEQLGYQAEAGTWRNAYLMGAFELRNGMPQTTGGLSSASPDVVSAIPLEMFFDYLGVRLDAQKAQGRRLVINWHFTDLNRTYTLNLENSALTWRVDQPEPQPDASVRLARSTLDEISTKRTTFPREVVAGRVKIEGNQAALGDLMGMIEEFSPAFPIVTPR